MTRRRLLRLALAVAALATACGKPAPTSTSNSTSTSTSTSASTSTSTSPSNTPEPGPPWTHLALRWDGRTLELQGFPSVAADRLARLFAPADRPPTDAAPTDPGGRADRPTPHIIVADGSGESHDPSRTLAIALALTRFSEARLVVDGTHGELRATARTEADQDTLAAEIARQLGDGVTLELAISNEPLLPPLGHGLVAFGSAAAMPPEVRAFGPTGLGPPLAPPAVASHVGLVVLPAGLYALDGAPAGRALVVPPNLRVDLEPGAPSLVVGGRRVLVPKRVPLREPAAPQSFAALDQDDEHPRWTHRYRAPAEPLLPGDLAELRSFVKDLVFITTPSSLADEMAAEVAAGTSSHLAVDRDGTVIQRLDLLEAARCGAPEAATALCVVVAVDPAAPGLGDAQRRSLDDLFALVATLFPDLRPVAPDALGGWRLPDPFAERMAHPVVRDPPAPLPAVPAATSAPEPARVSIAWRRGERLVASGLAPSAALERLTADLAAARAQVIVIAPPRPSDLAPDRAAALLAAVTRLDEADLALAEGRATLTGKAYNAATLSGVDASVHAALPGVALTSSVVVDGATPHPDDGFLDLPEPAPSVVKDLDDRPVALDELHHIPWGLYRLADGSIVGVRRGQRTKVVAGAAAIVVAGERVPLGDASLRVVAPGDVGAPTFPPDPARRRPGDVRTLDLDAVVLSTDHAADARAGFERLRASGTEVHFIIDFDGTIFETLDPAWTPREPKPPAPRTLAARVADGTITVALTDLAPDLRMDLEAPSFPPDHPRADELARHPRPRGPLGEIHGRKVETYGYTDAQYRALAALLGRLAELGLHAPWEPVRDRGGRVRTDVLPAWTPADGVVLGCFHLDPASTDPGPGFDWDRLAKELGAEVSRPLGAPR